MESIEEGFRTEAELEEALSRPTQDLVKAMSEIEGDLIFLGVSGKMGVSMAVMAKRASEMAGIEKKVIGVSRFSNPANKGYLADRGIEVFAGNLLDRDFLDSLPDVGAVVYLAGTKFGTTGNEAYTWAMNTYLAGLVAERYKNARIVALSTGCVYNLADIDSKGSKETDSPYPIGEYAQSCLGRERMFEYGSSEFGTRTSLIRLNYSVEMRYGVLVDIAQKVANKEPVDVSMGYANVIWQGDANALILQSFLHCASPPQVINVTGLDRISVRDVASQFGKLLGKEPNIVGSEQPSALLSNAAWMAEHVGLPSVPLQDLIHWTANWIKAGNATLNKPTHFEVRDGTY